MKRSRLLALAALIAVAAAVAITIGLRRPRLLITGVVTTDETIVSSEIPGRLQQLTVKEGDLVTRGQLLGTITPAEGQADLAYARSREESAAARVTQAEADLKLQEQLTVQQIAQAEANVAAARAAIDQAAAEEQLARLSFERIDALHRSGVDSVQEFDQARAAQDSARARVAALHQQAEAVQAALGLARAGAAQVAVRRAALNASRQQLAAATAQRQKAAVRLGYAELHAPGDGIVNVRAALPGEVVNAGQAVVTLIDPSNLWVRLDVEESYIDRVRIGDTFTVRLASGAERKGTVFFRGVDAGYATQRDVSRTKRDIKTFEVRLRCDNRDRSLAVGMTAYVALPFER